MGGLTTPVLVAATLALLGCGAEERPTAPEADARAVWSDDDERIAVAFEWFEDDFVHEVWTVDAAGGLDGRLVGPRPGSVHALYFMRSAGYALVVGSIAGSGQFVDRIDLDGTVTRLVEGADPTGRLLPAPDGSTLARVRVADCDELRMEGRGTCIFDVDLLDPATGEPLAAPLHLLFGPEEGVEQGVPDWIFQPGGHLLLSDGNLTYEVGPDGALIDEPASAPTCFRPRTSSSDISREGRTVLWDRFDQRVAITPPEAPGYPDRCFDG